jgi:hypothetical protein
LKKINANNIRSKTLCHTRSPEAHQRLQDQVKNPTTTDDVNVAATTLQDQIKTLRRKIKEERPAWRFKLGVWPVRTKGWPFNQDANQFAELLLSELNFTSDKIEIAVKIANKIMERRQLKEEAILKNAFTLQPDLSLTALDKKILNTVKDPNEVRVKAAKLSQINQIKPENVSESATKKDKDEEVLEKTRKSANQWFDNFKTSFTNWENGDVQFKVFTKKDDPRKALKDILDYRDKLPKDLADGFVKSWESLSYLINLEVEYPDENLDEESVEQMNLLIKLIDILNTEYKTNERKISEDKFNIESQQILTKREMSAAVRGYSTHGLLGRNSPRSDQAPQNKIDLPTLSVSAG